jgi:hypothetical protein
VPYKAARHGTAEGRALQGSTSRHGLKAEPYKATCHGTV